MFKFKSKSKVLIFGTGAGGRCFYKDNCKRYNVIGFIDNNQQKQGELFLGKRVFAPQEISMLDYDKIIIASDYYVEIFEQLTAVIKVNKERIFFFFDLNSNDKHWLRQFLLAFESLMDEMICNAPKFISYFLYQIRYKKSNVKLLPFYWLDQQADACVYQFMPAISGVVYGPRFVGRNQVVENVELPAVNLYRFSNGQVCSASRSILFKDTSVIIERVATSISDAAEYNGGHLLYHGNKRCLIRQDSYEIIDKGIVITGCSETNYYHWMIEILSQLQFVSKISDKFSDYPVLISARCERIPAISMLVNVMFKGKRILLNSNKQYLVSDLLVLSAPNNLVANSKSNQKQWSAADCFARKESIDYLRGQAFNLVDESVVDSFPKRIFLARKPVLRQYNQEQVESILAEYGFCSVYMEDLDIRQQVALVSNAEFIVGPTGAAWTNIIFASKGTKALCWMAEEFGDLACFSNIAEIVGVEMDYIGYQGGTSDSRKLYYQGYKIDLAKVSGWINEVGLTRSVGEY